MNWITVIWSGSMGACLILALMHLLVWCRDFRSLPNLVFPIIALGIIAMGACELALMRTGSLEVYLETVRLGHLLFGIVVAASLLFLHSLFGTGSRWLLALAIALRAAAVVANYTTGPCLHFLSIESLDRSTFLGESVSIVGEAIENPWVRLGQIATLVQVLYVADASVRLGRRGGGLDRHRAFWIGGSLVSLFLLAMVIAGLISAGVLRAPMLVSFPFFGMVLAISYDMSRDLQRTALLARELESSERRLALAGSAGRLAFWEWDLKSDSIWVSEKGWEVFGIERREKLGFAEFIEHVHEADRSKLQASVRVAVDAAGTFSAEFRVGDTTGKERWLAGSGRIETNESGEPVLFRGVSIDVTEQKKAEAHAALQRSELTLLSRVSTLGALSGSLAHELNQPLTAILGNAQAGRRRLGSPEPDLTEMGEILDDIIGDTKRAGSIVHGMRAMFTREVAAELEPVDLNAAVRGSLALINSEIGARHGVVEFTPSAAAPSVMARIVEVQQVVINLVLNGLDAFAPDHRPGESPQVRLHLEGPNDGFAVIEVRDNGPGIPDELRDRLFEPFFSTKSDRGGLGLGLSISRGIVERFGGTLEALPGEPGNGAAFRIRLPAVDERNETCHAAPTGQKIHAEVK
jgi:two-component system sensor kinase FixL